MVKSSSKTNGAKARKVTPRKASKGPGGVQNILNFALFFEKTSGGSCNVPRKRLLTMSGVKANTFPVTLCNMKKKGLIEYNKDTVQLTKAGRAKAEPVTNLPTDNASAQKDIKIRFKISGKPAVLFDQLVDGRTHKREIVVGGLGFKSKNSAAVMLSNLKKNGIIEYDKTTIKLTDICFPFGRPSEATNKGNRLTEESEIFV